MTESPLHPVPRRRDVVLEQIRAVGLSLRRDAIVAAAVLGIVTFVIASDIVRGSAATWFDSDDWAPIGIASLLFPFVVWRSEKRFGPAFLWTLPVDRRLLSLTKVLAGWVWLIIAIAVFVFWQIALAVLSGVAGAQTVPFFAFIGATALYLLGSAVVLGVRHPLRWVLATAAVLFLLGFVDQALGRRQSGLDTLLSTPAFFSTIHDAAGAWRALPELAQSAIATFVSLAFGLAALWAAASRHGERRRQ